MHFFTVSEVDGRLMITPTVRYFTTHLLGKQIDRTRLTLTVKQGERLTFREKTKEPVETALSWNLRRYSQLGHFLMGNCKVRDVEAFSTARRLLQQLPGLPPSESAREDILRRRLGREGTPEPHPAVFPGARS